MRKLQVLLLIIGSTLEMSMAAANTPPLSMDTFHFEVPTGQPYQPGLRIDSSLPAPIVARALVTRGTRDFSNETNLDDGSLWILVTLPEGSVVSMAETGFQFRVVSGQVPRRLQITDQPVRSLRIQNDGSSFNFYWQDGAPEQHDEMDFILEISVVTKDRRVGPATTLRIK